MLMLTAKLTEGYEFIVLIYFVSFLLVSDAMFFTSVNTIMCFFRGRLAIVLMESEE